MTNLTRRNFLLGSLGFASLFTIGGLSGCSGSAAWYQLDKFFSQDPSSIIKELEENQGFEYEGEQDLGTYISYDRYYWSGVPKDSLTDDGAHAQIEIYKSGLHAMSRDELLAGEEIVNVTVTFATDAFDNGSVQSITKELIEKCGFKNTEVEGMHDYGYVYIAAGPCQFSNQDAYWRVDIWEGGYGTVSVALNDDRDMIEVLKENVEQ